MLDSSMIQMANQMANANSSQHLSANLESLWYRRFGEVIAVFRLPIHAPTSFCNDGCGHDDYGHDDIEGGAYHSDFLQGKIASGPYRGWV